MLNKISEKYNQLKESNKKFFEENNKEIQRYDKEIIKNFLELYNKEVKIIHSNEEKIEKNLQILFYETKNMQDNTNTVCKIYDNLVEYFKEAGDLYNWCSILEKEMNDIGNLIIEDNDTKNKNIATIDISKIISNKK